MRKAKSRTEIHSGRKKQLEGADAGLLVASHRECATGFVPRMRDVAGKVSSEAKKTVDGKQHHSKRDATFHRRL